MNRREYEITPIQVNKFKITKVIIDPHYKEKHGQDIDDELILNLVKKLDGRMQVPEEVDEDGFSYFVTLIMFEKKKYRLIWLLEEGAIYIGVINAFRDSKKG